MRFARAAQGLVGFLLLTAVISWLLGVFPVLSRQGALSQHVDLVRQHEDATGHPFIDSAANAVSALFVDLTQRVITAESDLTHTPVSCYFAEAEGRASVPLVIGFLLHQARLTQRAGVPPGLPSSSSGQS